ncbi:DinB family protein [Ideonella sp.]|uniref:DinB family protein n=1 Tax=Ideonella sp. TaxID=1929293 RepID=UPI0035B3B2E8
MSTSTLLLSLFQYKAWANAELFAELRQVDAEAHAAQRHTAIRLLNHIYVVDRIFVGHLSGTPHGHTGTNTTETPTLDALQAAVAETDRWYIDHVATLSPERLREPVSFTFTDGLKGCMTREEMLAHVITHGGYHRGAVGNVMRQADVQPPKDTFTRFLHVTEPERRER